MNKVIIDLSSGIEIISEMNEQEILEIQESFLTNEQNQTYADKRRNEYPPIAEQLDMIFHGGIDAWKIKIQEIKDKYPKE